VLRQTIRKRLQKKLKDVKTELGRRRHDPIPEQARWPRKVIAGHIRYYGVPMNSPALSAFGGWPAPRLTGIFRAGEGGRVARRARW
jgi:hypothetical protein